MTPVRSTADPRRLEGRREALTRLALNAEPVFATHAELLDWLKCAARCWFGAEASGDGCDAGKATACAIVSRAACRYAASAQTLEAHMKSLPTGRLEALLLLASEARREAQPPGG